MILTFSCMQSCLTVARIIDYRPSKVYNLCADTHTFDQLRVGHFVTKHNKMCSLPYAMTANKTYLSTYFLLKLLCLLSA